MPRPPLVALGACLLLALPGRGVAQPALATAAAPPTGSGPTAPAPGARPGTDRLRPGDVVRLRIWREPDLSGDFVVDREGIAVLPKLGPVAVADVPSDTVRARLTAQYTRYLRQPSVEVTALRRIAVLGAVHTPGLYTVDPTVTIAHVVALAGGSAPNGQRNKVEVLRDGAQVRLRLSSRTTLADGQILSGDQIFVPERSWVAQNAVVVSAVITGIASLGIALLTR